MVATAELVCGLPIRVEMAPHREDDPPLLIGSSLFAQALLGWQPARSALEIQIADAWNWMMKGRR